MSNAERKNKKSDFIIGCMLPKGNLLVTCVASLFPTTFGYTWLHSHDSCERQESNIFVIQISKPEVQQDCDKLSKNHIMFP